MPWIIIQVIRLSEPEIRKAVIPLLVIREQLLSNNKIILYFGTLLAGASFILVNREMQAFLFVAFILLAAIIAINKIDDPVVRKILFAALLLRFALALIQSYSSIDLPGAGSDSIAYERFGWEYAQAWYAKDYSFSVGGAYFYYSALIGLPYYFLGRFFLAAQLMNILFGILLVFYIYQMTLKVTGLIKAARMAILLAAFFPTHAFFSAILLREIIIIFFILFSAYMLVLWLQRGSFYMIIVSFLAIAAASLFHGSLVVIGLVQIFMVTFYRPLEKKFRISLKQVLFASIIILLFLLTVGELITYKMPENFFEYFSLDHFRSYVENITISRTHYLDGLVPESYFDLLWQTPVRIVYFMFAPFPWMIENLRDALGFLDVFIYILLSFYGLKGIKKLFKRKKVETVCIVFFVVSIVTMYSWGVANYGTAWRHRAKLAPFMIVTASVGMASGKRWDWLLPGGSDNIEMKNNELNPAG